MISDMREKSASEKLKVLVAEHQSVVREGLRSLIASSSDLEVIGEADNGQSVEKMIREKHPDLLILNPSMPGKTGLELTKQSRDTDPLLKILILTNQEQIGYLRMLLKAGASGYILRNAGLEELMRAIRSVAAGSTYIDPILAGNFFGHNGSRVNCEEHLDKELLSKREQEVLSLCARGYSNKEISALLLLSGKTIETYKARSMEKLGLNNRVDLMQFARQAGWLDQS